jgi:ATP-dependent protease HslVU (ClpYQ) peptidase subunit
MTIVVSARRDGKVIIGADSLTTIGDRKLVKLKNKSKLFKFNYFVVGVSGTGPLLQVLERMSQPEVFSDPSNREDSPEAPCDIDWMTSPINNTIDCSLFLSKYMSIFADLGDAEDMADVELLIATPTKIFTTVGESEVFEIEDFWAVGSGAPWALGAMEALWGAHNSDDNWLEEISGYAIEVACKYSAGCEPPVEIFDTSNLISP